MKTLLLLLGFMGISLVHAASHSQAYIPATESSYESLPLEPSIAVQDTV